MDETPRTEPEAGPTKSVRDRSRSGLLWAVLAVVIAFFAGFLWQFYEAYTVREQLTEAEQELVLERLQMQLGQAALAAQSGDYERARQQMSTFFNRIQEQPEAFPPGVAGTAESFLSMRDDIITGLSRSNPEYGAVLYGMFQEFGAAVDDATGTPAASADGVGASPPESPPARPDTGAPGGDAGTDGGP